MTHKVKTKLTRKEVQQLLKLYNKIDDIVDHARDMFDVRLSSLNELDDAARDLKNMFNFRPPIGRDGDPNHWKDSVLPDDPDAWYFKEDND